MIDTRKDDFIDDYIEAAQDSPTDCRKPDQLYSDALAEWEAREIDKATERYKQRDQT